MRDTFTKDHHTGPMWQEANSIVAIAVAEEKGVLALGLGDGSVRLRLLAKPETALFPALAVHEGGLTGLALAGDGNSFISAGDDGTVQRLHIDGSHQPLWQQDKAFLEQMLVHPETGLIAIAYKKTVVVCDGAGNIKNQFTDHPSSIAGLCFDPKGKRLAVSHYNGVSLWWVQGEAGQQPQRLTWKGSHLGLGWSPNGKYLLSTMQENALHGWKMPEGKSFQMSGYAQKPTSFQWDENSKWLASSGSVGIICWDCSGKGPMGRAPLILGEACDDITTQVAIHPRLDLVAAGTQTGLVYLARFQDEQLMMLETATASPITALRWSQSGQFLLAGAEDGYAYAWGFAG